MSSDSNALVYLGLGSNEGHREAALQEAVDRIHALSLTKVTCVSPVYETDPWGYAHQNNFLNAALAVRTSHSAAELFHLLQQIEREMGRVPAARYHPRLIDIDIIFYNADIVDTPELTIPHPSMQERLFVLVPMCSVAPNFVHPVFGKTLSKLCEECMDDGAIRQMGLTLRIEKL